MASAASRYIVIPPDLPLFNMMGERLIDESGTPASMSFRQFLAGRLVDPKFSLDMESVLVAREIRDALGERKPGDCLELPDGHWKRLKEVTERPTVSPGCRQCGQRHGYQGEIAFNLVPFMNAIVDAKDKRPAEQPEAPATN